MAQQASYVSEPRVQNRVAALMLGIVLGTCLLLSALANSEPVLRGMRAISWEENRSKKQIPLFAFNEHYNDFEERLLHQELPSADYSRGGVYFFGASAMKWALKTWDLPLEIRPFIHNYAFGGSKHSDNFDFIRYLVDSEKMLRAGPDKTLCIFGVTYHTVHHGRVDGAGPGDYFKQTFSRHNFYSVTDQGVIANTALPWLYKKIILERCKMTGFLKELVNILYVPLKSVRIHNPEYYNSRWKEALGADWERLMNAELKSLQHTFQYLHKHKVNTAVIILPGGSWELNQPYRVAYDRSIREICLAENVPLHDCSRLIADDHFADSNHLTPDGIEEFQPHLVAICADFLRSKGMISTDFHSDGP